MGKHVASPSIDTSESKRRRNMSTYRTHVDGRPPLHTQRKRRETDLDQLRSDHSRRLDPSIRRVPAPAQPPSHFSTNTHNNAQSTAEVVGIRLLTVLAVALFVTSIIGLTVVSQDRNSTTAIVSGVIGISSALLGFIIGFHSAYRATAR
jgi:hypothetical protein